MTDTTYLKQNDTSPTLDAILTDAKGQIVDVTDAIIRFHMMKIGETTLKIDATGSVIDGPAGHVRYALQYGDTDTPGTYRAEYQVRFPDGSVETFKNTPDYLLVVITPELG